MNLQVDGIYQRKYDGIVRYRVMSSNRHNKLMDNGLKESRKGGPDFQGDSTTIVPHK